MSLLNIIVELISFLGMKIVFFCLPGWLSLRSPNWRLPLGDSDASCKLSILITSSLDESLLLHISPFSFMIEKGEDLLTHDFVSLALSAMCQASKEFGDARLKTHILTLLKSMQSRKKFSSSSSSDTGEKKNGTSFPDENMYTPAELFGIIAECERQPRPGQALLLQAKNLCWSLLAAIASCFPDVSPLSCLTVWLEITAARLPS